VALQLGVSRPDYLQKLSRVFSSSPNFFYGWLHDRSEQTVFNVSGYRHCRLSVRAPMVLTRCASQCVAFITLAKNITAHA
jgi:hypothetical protein